MDSLEKKVLLVSGTVVVATAVAAPLALSLTYLLTAGLARSESFSTGKPSIIERASQELKNGGYAVSGKLLEYTFFPERLWRAYHRASRQ